MTITINLETIVTNIGALTITGVTNIVDLSQIPIDAEGITPILYPRPDNFITDISPERVSQGSHGSAKMDLSYTLHYVYLHAPIGSGVNVLAVYQGMITNIVAILGAIFTNDDVAGAVDLTLESISDIGPLSDPAGNGYHGVNIALRVLEFIQ